MRLCKGFIGREGGHCEGLIGWKGDYMKGP